MGAGGALQGAWVRSTEHVSIRTQVGAWGQAAPHSPRAPQWDAIPAGCRLVSERLVPLWALGERVEVGLAIPAGSDSLLSTMNQVLHQYF